VLGDMTQLARAFLTWIVVFAALLFVTAMFGLVSTVEVSLVAAVSIGVTFFILRRWDRSRTRREGDTTGT
jgi:hypothetical protein